nr:hypothetical protein [uncultured bacterium]
MTKKWRKLGLLYAPTGPDRHPKLASHAANPLPVHHQDDVYRIFYSGRDAFNRSSVGAVDIDIVSRHVVTDHPMPFFVHGAPGQFFESGVSIGNCYEAGGVRYMLFMGWQTPSGGHWRGDVGRLIVHSDLTLELDGDTPLMSASLVDPISLSYPWVRSNEDGGFDMWYGSTATWDAGNGEMLHQLNHAVSADGHAWNRKGLAVPCELGVAQAFSRPTVAGGPDGSLDMWFSYRGAPGKAYRIGHAMSKDGRKWELSLNEEELGVSAEGWDSEMTEYPFVFDHKGRRYMLYNGNGFGKSGFGLAVLESYF